ncbi:MAG: hypothetical protein K2Y27_25200 [Xanthobacteraceae bacterium]|nr:hypothetical protein [Xanthobacteraceae bacterium]
MDERVPNPQGSLPVVIEPYPTKRRAAIVGTVMASLGMAAVVVLVLYGLSRPDMPQQTASAPSQTAQPAPAGNTGGQNQQAATPEATTTGQGQGQSAEPDKQPPNQGKGERSDSATTGAQPSDQPKPPQQ